MDWYFQNGSIVNAFGQRANDSLLVARCGNTGHLSLDKARNLYYADYYPYKISKYTPDMELISVFSRKADFLRPPIQVPSKKIPNSFYIASQGGIKDIAICDDNLFILLNKGPKQGKLGEDDKIIQLLDLFNNITGEWILTIPVDKYFKISWTRYIKIDKSGNLYVTSDDPFPHVAKLCFEIKDIYGNIIYASKQ